MSTSIGKHIFSMTISLLLILALFLTARLYPSIGIPLGMIFLFFGLAATGYAIVKKNREAYVQSRLTRGTAIRNALLESTGILLAMVLAGAISGPIAEATAGPIRHEMTRMIAGIVIGLLAGTVIGALIKRASSRLVKT